MKQVKKSVLLWYSAREMYELVTGIESYPRFLPWCDKAEVLERHEGGVTARLGLAYAGVSVSLVDGPFSVLDGTWLFKALGDPAAERRACKVQLDLRYGFSNGALERVVSPVFDKVANTLVDSFVQRAEQVYGPR
jgi:ribosome-associated toxin RatA of RatAB toxin-antitoxin module